MKKGFLDVSFTWLFAIIAGIFILFLAIYGSTKLVKIGQGVQDAKTGKEIGILLNPLETGFETGKTNSFTIPVDTKIYSGCEEDGIFGKQIIMLSQKNFGKWSKTNINVFFKNKYIFAKTPSQGRKFYLFSKPFKFPFKIADLTYMTSSQEKYCFANPPEKIKDELTSMMEPNILINNCSKEDIKICFSDEKNCSVYVNYENSYIQKKDGKIYFDGDALMYAGIFADKNLYECQLRRLMKRAASLAMIYKDKSVFVSKKGCNSNINAEMILLVNQAENLNDSKDLYALSKTVDKINEKNNWADCRLW